MLMKRVYVAGPYSADNVITVLDNIREGMRAGTMLLLKGFAPFVPWLDFHFQLMLKEEETLFVEDYYNYSIEWLKVSDCMLVLKGWENSTGTRKEVELAKSLRIPIYYDLDDLLKKEK